MDTKITYSSNTFTYIMTNKKAIRQYIQQKCGVELIRKGWYPQIRTWSFSTQQSEDTRLLIIQGLRGLTFIQYNNRIQPYHIIYKIV